MRISHAIITRPLQSFLYFLPRKMKKKKKKEEERCTFETFYVLALCKEKFISLFGHVSTFFFFFSFFSSPAFFDYCLSLRGK